MRVRPATAADIPAMLRLERQCPTAAHWTDPQYQSALRRDECGSYRLVLVIDCDAEAGESSKQEEASQLVAFLVAHHAGPEWELENIVVASSARWQGLGAALLKELLTRAQETKSDSVFLEVRESNQPARALYQNWGFQEVGRRHNYYANPPEDAILYRRVLL